MVSGLPSTNDARIHEYRAPVIRVFVSYSWMALRIARIGYNSVGLDPPVKIRVVVTRVVKVQPDCTIFPLSCEAPCEAVGVLPVLMRVSPQGWYSSLPSSVPLLLAVM